MATCDFEEVQTLAERIKNGTPIDQNEGAKFCGSVLTPLIGAALDSLEEILLSDPSSVRGRGLLEKIARFAESYTPSEFPFDIQVQSCEEGPNFTVNLYREMSPKDVFSRLLARHPSTLRSVLHAGEERISNFLEPIKGPQSVFLVTPKDESGEPLLLRDQQREYLLQRGLELDPGVASLIVATLVPKKAANFFIPIPELLMDSAHQSTMCEKLSAPERDLLRVFYSKAIRFGQYRISGCHFRCFNLMLDKPIEGMNPELIETYKRFEVPSVFARKIKAH